MMERNFEEERQEIITRTFEKMRTAKEFEIQSSGGKQVWHFKYDHNGDLMVQPPNHFRYTKVLHPVSTLVAIAKSKEFFELNVKPLPETETEDAIKEVLLMIRIESPCFT